MNVIKPIFKTFFLSLCVIANVHFAYAQQGGIIPNALNVFLDNNGKPLSSGKVYFYIPSTTTPKTTYSDINLTFPNTNPVILDAAGRPNGSKGLWGTGNYRQQVFDKNNNLIWDQTTSISGSGGGGTATGDGDLVGTIKPWGGMVAPNQYMFAYGAEVSRTTFAALFAAITSTQSVFCTSTSPTLTGLSDTTNFWVGMTVETPCVTSGVTTIISKTSTTVVLAVNANISTNANSTFFPWGNGNGSSTFNLPDFRGLIPVGNNIMGGVASSNISDTYFGTALAESSGGQGGSSNGGSIALAAANLAAHTHASSTLTDPQHTHNLPSGLNTTSGGGAQSGTAAGANYTSSGQTVSSSSTGITISANTGTNSTGISTPFSILPPLKTVNYIIKVTPDQNSATASGVTSLGLMTGDIACGAGLTCTGNTISTTGGGGGSGTVTAVAINAGANITLTGTCNSTTTINCTVSTSATTNTCPIGYFCVSNFANTAAAVTALNSAGGGTLYFNTSATVSAAQAIAANTRITCAGKGVVLGTSSTTADLFDFGGSASSIDNCTLAFTGTPGTKTVGALIHGLNTAADVTVSDVNFGGNCFICVNFENVIAILHNTEYASNTAALPSGSGVVQTTAEVTHLSNMTVNNSSVTNAYTFGISQPQGALDGVNLEIISVKTALQVKPGSGQVSVVRLTNSYLDNCYVSCALLQPAASGTIGLFTASGTEFGINCSAGGCAGASVLLDQAGGGGTIGQINISNSNVFSYGGSVSCIQVNGVVNDLYLMGNAVGPGCFEGLVFSGTGSSRMSINSNSFSGSAASFVLPYVATQAQITLNRMNGGTVNSGGNSSTNFFGNLP